jgi:selenocysteine lyase/cysteine desulfurase
MRTEVPFTLPRGFVGPDGILHREGAMRLATARDELEAIRDPAVRQHEAYLTVLLLERVVTRLGDLPGIDRAVIEGLYAADFDHLQRLYERLNTDGEAVGTVTCPHCAEPFEVDLTEIEDGRLGE